MKFREIAAQMTISSIFALSCPISPLSGADVGESIQLRPANVPVRANAEYYPSSPDAGVTMPVHVWGNVREPGLHYMPLGSSLGQTISAAGGPTDIADTNSVRLMRAGKPTYVDLLGPKSVPMQANDLVYVDRSYRADLPLIMSGVSTVISIVTLYYVVQQKK